MNKVFQYLFLLIGLSATVNGYAQYRTDFDGQVSSVVGYSPEANPQLFVAGRYLPRFSLAKSVDSTRLLDFEASLNASADYTTLPWDTSGANSDLSLYRLWLRYSGEQFELRAGLQKMDFGSASMLRPLQWFNQIDPRDPLQLTNGVTGLLFRYYFLNNANVWVWGLYGNERTRGFDAIETRSDIPEFGGRLQLPAGPGELALTYHHRTAVTKDLVVYPDLDQIPEDRLGLDGKWDIGIGLWFELSYSHKHQAVKPVQGLGLYELTYQTMGSVGADYTFSWGNGLNVMAEHFVLAYDSTAMALDDPVHLSALMANYPLGMFNNLSVMVYMNWVSEEPILLLNYQHQFKHFSTYVLAYYNPESAQGIQENDLVNNFTGPGIRLMLVYNH